MRRACAGVLSILLLAACAHRDTRVAKTSAPSPSSVIVATHAPRVIALASTAATPTLRLPATPPVASTPVPTLAPSSVPSPVPTPRSFNRMPPPIVATSIPMMPPDALPEIVDVEMADDSITPGETVTGAVLASSNVASVELRIERFGLPMEKLSPGHFWIELQVPQLPFYLRHRTYTIVIIARNTRGDAVSRELPVTIH